MTTLYLNSRIETEERSDSTPKQIAAVIGWMRRNWARYYHGEPEDLTDLAERASWEYVIDIETAQRLAAEVMKEKTAKVENA